MPTTADDLTVQVKAAVIESVKALNLAGDDEFSLIGQNVYGQLVDDPTNIMTPCVIVTQHEQQDELLASTFETEHWWIPMLVLVADRVAPTDDSKTALYSSWRSQLRDFFQHQPIRDLTFVHQCEVRLKSIADSDLKRFQYLKAALLLRILISVSRTLNV